VHRDERARREAENHADGAEQAADPPPLEGPDDAHMGARGGHRLASVPPGFALVRRRWWTAMIVDERSMGYLNFVWPPKPTSVSKAA
jgi:hypothetical protein